MTMSNTHDRNFAVYGQTQANCNVSFFDVCRFLKYVHGSLDLIPKTPHKVYGIKFFVVKLDHNAPMHNDKVVQLSQQNVRYSKDIGWTQLNDQLNK